MTRHALPGKVPPDSVRGTIVRNGSGQARAAIMLLIAGLCCASACTPAIHTADVNVGIYETGGSSKATQDRDGRGASGRDSADAYESLAGRSGSDEPLPAGRVHAGSDLYGASDARQGRISGTDQKSVTARGNLYERQAGEPGGDVREADTRGRRGPELYAGARQSADRALPPVEKGAQARALYEEERQEKKPGRLGPDRNTGIARERREADLYGVAESAPKTKGTRRSAGERAAGKSRTPTETEPGPVANGPSSSAPLPPKEAETDTREAVIAPPAGASVPPSPVPGEGAINVPAPPVPTTAKPGGGEDAGSAAEAGTGAGAAAVPEPVKTSPPKGRILTTPLAAKRKAPEYSEQRRETEAILELSGKKKQAAEGLLVVHRPPNIQGLTGLLFTNSAYTLPPGRAAVGASLLTEYSRRPEFSVIQVPVTLTYGVTDRVEMGLKAKIVDLDSPSYLQRAHGYGDSEVSVKWRFASQRFILPDMAVGVCYIMPTGNEHKHLNEVVNWGAKFMAIASLEGKTSGGNVFGVYLESQAVFIDELFKSGSSTPGAERYGIINGGVLLPVSDNNRLQLIAEYNQILYKSSYRPTMIEGNENAATAAFRYVTEQFSSTAGVQYINKEKSTDQNTYRFVWKVSLTF